MKIYNRINFILLLLLLAGTEIYGQWSCPSNCSCSNNAVSVECFGATPNDNTGDSAAIQNGINSIPDNWTLYFPQGVFWVDAPLEINRDNITLKGEGIESELKIPQGTNYILLSLPTVNYTSTCPHNIPENITIENLSFNGNFNRGTKECPIDNNLCSKTYGIFVFEGENVTIKDVLVKEFALEGIAVGVGSAPPKNVTLYRVKAEKMRRTSIHLGQGENITIEDSFIEDGNSPQWLPTASGGPAIDIEMEGFDLICNPNPNTPHTYRDGSLFGINVKNTLIKSPVTQNSTGGISISPAYGPVRKVKLENNVLLNTTGIASLGFDANSAPYGADPRVGQSLRIRDLNIESNWVSNLHPHVSPYDISTTSLVLIRSGEDSDKFGDNGVKINNNVLTVFINGSNNTHFNFAGLKETSGSNNKTFRPFANNEGGNPANANINFIWRKDFSGFDNDNVNLVDTLDNGWAGSRLACYDPIAPIPWTYCSSFGTNSSLTWLTNPDATPTTLPTFGNIFIHNKIYLWLTVNEPNNKPVRVMVTHNGLPIGIRTINGTGFIKLNKKASQGDLLTIQAINENGLSAQTSVTN